MMASLRFAWALAVLAIASPAVARNCTRAERADGDRWTQLSTRDYAGSIRRNLPWGLPVATTPPSNERLVVLTEYVNQFDDDLLIPLWSAERLASARLDTVRSRINCFRPHPRVLPESDLGDDYDDPTYDQGHLTPSDDQSTSVRAMVNTYFYTNMAPQFGPFNRVTWRRLEAVVHDWARPRRTLYVITGSILDRDNDGLRDSDLVAQRVQPRHGRPARVAIPTAFYKIIAYRRTDGRIATLSIALPHNATSLTGRALGQHFKDHVTTISALERATGLDFFPNATEIVEETDFCVFADGAPRSLCSP
jgi:endonuclease G, mitochondrial